MVALNWNNVTAGNDPDTFGLNHSAAIHEGMVVAGVTTRTVGVYCFAEMPMGLKSWDPERYGIAFDSDR